jgi:hypothetical protein
MLLKKDLSRFSLRIALVQTRPVRMYSIMQQIKFPTAFSAAY